MKAFYLCHDPIGIMPEGMVGFVYTPDKPRFFASLLTLDHSRSMPEMDYAGCNTMFRYENTLGEMQYYILITVQNIDKASPAALTAALEQCAEWYSICLTHMEAKATGKAGGWNLLAPYNERLKDVQLLQFNASGTYLLGYHDGVKDFADMAQVRGYMRSILKYPEEGVKTGMLNKF
jgi:hypothetical protein